MQRNAYPLPLVQRYLDFKISTSKIHKAEELLYIDFLIHLTYIYCLHYRP